MATTPQMHTSTGQQSEAENLRLAVAQQPTVEGSLAALLQGVFAVISEALDKGEPVRLQAFRDRLGDDPKAWRDAVVANTPSAMVSVGPFVGLPTDVQKAFNTYAMQHNPEAKQEQQGEAKPQAADKK